MSGCGAKDEGVKVLDRQQGAERRTISNILGAGEDSLGFQRTPAEVLRVARKYIDLDRLTTVVVGPVDKNGKLIEGEQDK